ncbi:hypothetical protein MOJ79_14420 [Calidifontimicrobium sp. SYSU G02091]|uniref:hypothetical protein n=1 Tax=Azohydromonas TaxID=312063 RepID=UPI0013C2A643|nr:MULTISPECIES: hypothetical protein [Azohydromonas]MCI1193035.1 hypothetical protein [Calidifontimicrobium sp. SYSU G02091]
MAMRLKTHWFKPEQPKSAEQRASAIAFIVWRVARQMLDRMRKAGFDIDVGPPYFAFLREVLVFLIQCADRIAYARQAGDERAAFTTALVLRTADFLEENEGDLLGPVAPGTASYRERFIDLFNEVAPHYAEFGYGDDGPDFGFRRYLGSRIEPLLPPKDRPWVLDQVMDIEAPEAVALVERGMAGVYSTEKRARRASALGAD